MRRPICVKCKGPLNGYIVDDSLRWKCGLTLCKDYMLIVSSTPLKDLEVKA